MLDVITHLEMAAADYRRQTTPNQSTITWSAAIENERLANQFQLAAEALRQMHNRLFEEGIVAGVKNIAASCEARRNRRASPASVPEGWKLVPEVPTEAMQDAMRSVLNMPANSYWAMLDAAPTPPVSEDRKDAELLEGLRNLCGFVEDGSSEAVTIAQDDATKDWIVRVGGLGSKRWWYGRSLKEALTSAMQEDKL